MDVLCDIVHRHDGTPNSLVEALRTKAQAAADGPLAAGAIALAVRVADV